MTNPDPMIDGSRDPVFDGVRDAFTQNFAEGDLGAGCAVTVEGELVVDLWGGHRDLARRMPWERDTIVNVWSTTKLGMDYGLNSEHTPLGVNDRTLWWAGWGGSMCVIDVENRLTVSYVMNRMLGEDHLRAARVILIAHTKRARMG